MLETQIQGPMGLGTLIPVSFSLNSDTMVGAKILPHCVSTLLSNTFLKFQPSFQRPRAYSQFLCRVLGSCLIRVASSTETDHQDRDTLGLEHTHTHTHTTHKHTHIQTHTHTHNTHTHNTNTPQFSKLNSSPPEGPGLLTKSRIHLPPPSY